MLYNCYIIVNIKSRIMLVTAKINEEKKKLFIEKIITKKKECSFDLCLLFFDVYFIHFFFQLVCCYCSDLFSFFFFLLLFLSFILAKNVVGILDFSIFILVILVFFSHMLPYKKHYSFFNNNFFLEFTKLLLNR
jgi:hypothetical protein